MRLTSSLDQLDALKRSAAERLRETLAFFEEGVEMKRRSLRRRFPQESDAQLQVRLLNWLQYQDET